MTDIPHNTWQRLIHHSSVLVPILALTCAGLAMVWSASAAISMKEWGHTTHYLQRQTLFFGVGLLAMITTSGVPHRMLRPLSYILLLAALISMMLVMTSMGKEAGGARRWLRLGSITFQPSEFAKFALLVFLAYSLDKKGDRVRQFFIGFFPHALLIGVFAALLMLQKDLGGIVIIGATAWIMMFIAGVRLLHLISVVPFLLPFTYFFIYKEPYRLDRIFSFLNPWADPLDTGFQLTHSLKAFGSGGIFGKGIGLGVQKLKYLPEPHTDFIFAVIGEELGLIGVLTIIGLYAVLLIRGTAIARRADSRFGALLAVGITTQLGLQTMINIGVTMGLLPTKGLTLPFISYGGTSLLVTLTAMGVLINISAAAVQPKAAPKPSTAKGRLSIGRTR